MTATSGQVGTASELLAAAAFTRLGYHVYFPWDKSHAVDFVVQAPTTGTFYRVQVKTGPSGRGSSIRCRIRDPYQWSDFDLLTVVNNNQIWCVPWVPANSPDGFPPKSVTLTKKDLLENNRYE
jgi:hypothetical protein